MASIESNANPDRVQVQIKSKQIRAVFGLSYLHSKKACEILQLLGKGDSQADVAKKLLIGKQGVNYYAKKFIKDNLLIEDAKSRPIIYVLTHFGQKVLTTCDSGAPKTFSFESLARKFRLVDNNFRRDCNHCLEKGCALRVNGVTNLCGAMWKKLGDPNNWKKYGAKYCGVSVELNQGKIPTVIIRTSTVFGENPMEMTARATEIIDFVKAKLYDIGISLSEDGELVNNPNFHVYSQEAEDIFKANGAVSTDNAQVDNSDDIEPHAETDLNGAVDWLNEAHNVKETLKTVKQLKAVSSSVDAKFVTVDEKMVNLVAINEKLVSISSSLIDSHITMSQEIASLKQELLSLNGNIGSLVSVLRGTPENNQKQSGESTGKSVNEAGQSSEYVR